jgi:hypothetical protein
MKVYNCAHIRRGKPVIFTRITVNTLPYKILFDFQKPVVIVHYNV